MQIRSLTAVGCGLGVATGIVPGIRSTYMHNLSVTMGIEAAAAAAADVQADMLL